jgi:hypothetical protein
MKNVSNSITVILAAALVLAFVTNANAGMDRLQKSIDEGKAKNTFNITARHVGSLEGQVWIGGKQVLVPHSTPVYVVGEGIQDGKYFASNEIVYIGGVQKRGKFVATMIVVRPSDSDARGRSAGSAKKGQYTKASGANPSVGESADNAPG